jgi:O-antigen/teichoic acid export membrane protein
VLIAVGRHRAVTGIWIGEAIANLVLSIVLVRRIGLVGVAVGTLAPLVVGHLIIMLGAACRAVGVSIARCVYETTRPAAIAAAVAAAACAIVRVARPPASASAVLTEAALVGLTYVASLATVGFDAETRRAYASQARRAVAAVAAGTAGLIGKRATKTEPDGPLSSSVSVP